MIQFFLFMLLIAAFSAGQAFNSPLPGFTRYLIPSNKGLPFYKETVGFNSVEIIYDCSIASRDKGVVDVFDSAHPTNIKSLRIENCYNITLQFPCSEELDPYYSRHSRHSYQEILFPLFRSVRVRDVVNLRLSGPQCSGVTNRHFPAETLSLSISNIENIETTWMEDGHRRGSHPRVIAWYFLDNLVHSLTLANLSLSYLNSQSLPSNLSALYLKAVEISEVDAESFDLGSGDAVVSITDSHLGTVKTKGFILNGTAKVEIQGNVIYNLENDAFTGTAKECFLLSGNNIRTVGSSFTVTTSNLQIVNNTFIGYRGFLLENLRIHSDTGALTKFNFSDNTLNFFSHFPYLSFQHSLPDLIVMKNNRLNCSCRTQEWVTETGVFKQIFINEKNNNVCANYNCSLGKLFRGIEDVCEGKFTCPAENVESEDFEEFLKRSVKVMVQHLENISDKLRSLEKLESFS